MTSSRRPCYPPTWDDNRTDGNCKWCNEPLPRNKDGSVSKVRRWHAVCKEIAWPVIFGSTNMLPRLARVHGYECVDCGDDTLGMLEVDHDTPLWSVDRAAADAWKYWTAENLVLRCSPCHKTKSAREAKQRAKEKRLNGTTGQNKRKAKIPSRGFPKPPPGYKHKIPSRPLRGKGP